MFDVEGFLTLVKKEKNILSLFQKQGNGFGFP